MRQRLRTYTAYSVGCAIAWAILLAAVAALDSRHVLRIVAVVFAGWWIGWISATIARAVYPPPARWQRQSARQQAA